MLPGGAAARTAAIRVVRSACRSVNIAQGGETNTTQGRSVGNSGIRRDQTEHRRATPIVERARNGQYKVCPLATWSEADMWRYINRHDLPVHPLMSQGYLSIGCAPCTRPVTDGEESRAGRWAGQAKTECGLHTDPPPPTLH